MGSMQQLSKSASIIQKKSTIGTSKTEQDCTVFSVNAPIAGIFNAL